MTPSCSVQLNDIGLIYTSIRLCRFSFSTSTVKTELRSRRWSPKVSLSLIYRSTSVHVGYVQMFSVAILSGGDISFQWRFRERRGAIDAK